MKYSFVWALIALVFVGGGCLSKTEAPAIEDVSQTIDRGSILVEAKQNGLIMNDDEMNAMSQQSPTGDTSGRTLSDVSAYAKTDVNGWVSAALADVTGGESYGLAYQHAVKGSFTVLVNMGNLPEPASDYFYEGWLVRRGSDLSVISTGRAVKTEKGYTNVYLSSTDLSDHDFFVLTLEPDDGNPAPAEHILEGSFR